MHMKNKSAFSIILVVIAVIIIVVVAVTHRSAKEPVSGTDTPVTVESGELITSQPILVSIAEDSYLLGIGGSYPQFAQADAAFNAKIKKVFTDEIAQFKDVVNEDYKARLEREGEAFQKQFESGGMYAFEIKTDVIQSNDSYISVVIHHGGYSGGAHPYQNVTTFNYDVKAQKELSITDFLGYSEASEKSREALIAKFKKDNVLDDSTQAMLEDGTDPTVAENFSTFTFTPEEVTIYFGQYQVAPYVYGEQQVSIKR